MTKAWDESTQSWERVNASGQALHTHEQGLGAGERNPDSADNGYRVVRQECNGSYLEDGTTTQQTVSAAPAHLLGIQVQQATAGTITIADGAASKFVAPAATPAGFHDFRAMRCETDLRITLSSASDDVLVLWRPI